MVRSWGSPTKFTDELLQERRENDLGTRLGTGVLQGCHIPVPLNAFLPSLLVSGGGVTSIYAALVQQDAKEYHPATNYDLHI